MLITKSMLKGLETMCGRYYIEIGDNEIEEITRKVQERLALEESQLTIKMSGEIFPTDIVNVKTDRDAFAAMKWGFPGFKKTDLLINARSETAMEKKTFKSAMENRRCLIPASGYFEWQKTDEGKIKHRFYVPGSFIYLAGCWQQTADELPCFVVLTRDAVGAAREIHERMPVIIPPDKAEAWIYESADVMADSVTELRVEAVA